MRHLVKPLKISFILTLLLMLSVVPNHAQARSFNELENWRARAQFMLLFPDASMDLKIEDVEIGSFGVDADNGVGGELDISYFIWDYLAVEASIGLISGYKTATVDTDGQTNEQEDEASIFFVPTSLNLQLHFAPYGRLTPYIGAGLNYNIGREGGTFTQTVGYNYQAGIDYWFNKKTGFSMEIKQLKKLQADLKPVTIEGFTVFRKANLEPTVFSIGIARRF